MINTFAVVFIVFSFASFYLIILFISSVKRIVNLPAVSRFTFLFLLAVGQSFGLTNPCETHTCRVVGVIGELYRVQDGIFSRVNTNEVVKMKDRFYSPRGCILKVEFESGVVRNFAITSGREFSIGEIVYSSDGQSGGGTVKSLWKAVIIIVAVSSVGVILMFFIRRGRRKREEELKEIVDDVLVDAFLLMKEGELEKALEILKSASKKVPDNEDIKNAIILISRKIVEREGKNDVGT